MLEIRMKLVLFHLEKVRKSFQQENSTINFGKMLNTKENLKNEINYLVFTSSSKKHFSTTIKSRLFRYLTLLENEKDFPCLSDEDRYVISLPPLTNAERTKVNENKQTNISFYE